MTDNTTELIPNLPIYGFELLKRHDGANVVMPHKTINLEKCLAQLPFVCQHPRSNDIIIIY